MRPLFCKSLPYHQNSETWFVKLANWENPVWLDSNGSARGRYDILTAEPRNWIQFERHQRGEESTFLQSLKTLLQLEQNNHHNRADLEPDLPFVGGLIGQLSYPFGRGIEQLESTGLGNSTADAEAGIYDWAIVQDHQRKRCTFLSRQPSADAQQTLARIFEAKEAEIERFQLTSELQASMSKAQYLEKFERIQDYILAGDCYQINIAQAYSAQFSGDPLAMYLQLRAISSAPFAGYFKGKSGTILCLSPERLVECRGRELKTQPIKGTAARKKDPAADKLSASSLLSSSKDRAENLMIVDLLRNDFGKVSTPGSVKVPDLFELQTFAAVHHLVSTITGELDEYADVVDGLHAVFPGGSITGAPKRRAMEIIEELEPFDRSVYCGSLFYLGYDGTLDSNIMIRTLLCAEDRVFCWGGGGIVVDSTAEAEWEEINSKIGHLLAALQSTRVET